MRHLLLAFLLTASLLVSPPFERARAEGFGAGFADLQLTDPVEGGPMAAIVFYPTRSAGGETQVGPFTLAASRRAEPAPGAYPLIVHSHGTGGSHLGHHDTLTALARAGFVAAAVQHPRDNFLDTTGFATDLQLIGRPHHIVALIDGVLGDARVGQLVDRARIGMAGFSAGGYTTLGYLFDRAGLAKVEVPVRLYRPTADEILVHPWNAERIAKMLPRPPEYQLIEGAGHYVFLTPCPKALASRLAAICKDPPGVDRAAIHARVNAEMIEFFRRTLAPR